MDPAYTQAARTHAAPTTTRRPTSTVVCAPLSTRAARTPTLSISTPSTITTMARAASLGARTRARPTTMERPPSQTAARATQAAPSAALSTHPSAPLVAFQQGAQIRSPATLIRTLPSMQRVRASTLWLGAPTRPRPISFQTPQWIQAAASMLSRAAQLARAPSITTR